MNGSTALLAAGSLAISPFLVFGAFVRRHLVSMRRENRAPPAEIPDRSVERPEVARAFELRVLDRTQQLQDLNEELEAFSYSVSHDLRAPLRQIEGFGELLTQRLGREDEMVTHYLDRIVHQARRAESLIDALLAFSQMGRKPIGRRDVDVEKMVASIADELASEQAERSVRWSFEKLPHVDADPAMLGVVWRNLLENALKYTHSRAIAEVRVGAERRGSQICFSVRDNGVGFDQRFAGRLFGPFQRLHPVSEFSGNGIGLATVRRIVARHGGRTWGEGEVDRGATFWFSLPDARGGRACPSPV